MYDNLRKIFLIISKQTKLSLVCSVPDEKSYDTHFKLQNESIFLTHYLQTQVT